MHRPDTPATDAACAQRPLRADAERNRRLILEVGARVFAERGLEATLNDIAKEAGVGVGTVYRKFPDKEAFVDALASEKFEALRALLTRSLQEAGPREGLYAYLLGAAEARACDRGLLKVIMHSGQVSPEVKAVKTRVLGEVAALVQRAADAPGEPLHFVAADIEMFMIMVGAVADRTRDGDPDAWRRYAEVLLDGFGLRPESLVEASSARSTSSS